MLKPICHPCQRFYRPEKNGFYFLEGKPDGPGEGRAEPGKAQPERWTPYKLWVGDLWKCQGCGHTIIVGTGIGAIAEHWQPHFAELLARYDVTYQVNDC